MTLIYEKENFSFHNWKFIVHLIRKYIVTGFKNKENNGCLRFSQMGLFRRNAKFVKFVNINCLV